MNILDELSQVEVFKGCDSSFVSEIFNHLRVCEIPVGRSIISFGDTTNDVYINFQGLLDVSYLLQEGKKVTFDLIVPRQFFGEISAIDGEIRSADIVALTKVKLGIIKHDFFVGKMLTNREFLIGLLNKSSSVIRNSNQQILHLASADSKKKVLIQLLRLARIYLKNSKSVKVVEGISHDTIASFVGLSRETVTRTIGLLKKDGFIIDTGKGAITLDLDTISSSIELSKDELSNWGNV